MASESATDLLPHEIRQLLSGLRWRIRAYVWLQGLSLAVAWLGLTFWCGLALDYLPVLAGIGEMPRFARAALLAGIAAILAAILYRWVLRRAFVRLADHSMAMLLERRNAGLGESLITAVELNAPGHQPESPLSRDMLADTRRQALSRLDGVRLGSVFNLRPLAISVSSAFLLAATIGLFYVVNANAWELGFGRLYLLKDDTWPRNARIEIVGVEQKEHRPEVPEAATTSSSVTPFRDGTLKVAKGSNLGLVVRADASRKVVPEVCAIHYRTAEGDYGRVNMTRIGRIRDGFQLYRYEGKPFDGILSDVVFDAVGFDHRLSGYRLQVVDSPEVVSVKLACEFPPYMVDQKLSLWLPRTVDLTAGTQLPQGTRLILQARSNKPLSLAVITDPDTGDRSVVELAGKSGDTSGFSHHIERLGEHLTLDVSLHDTDGVQSERPYRIHISGIEDTPPLIEMRLRGIGSAVTPNVLVPIEGKVTDDYGLAKSWLEVVLNDGEPRAFPLQTASTGEAALAVDFRTERGREKGVTLEPGAKLHLTIKATDHCDLGSGPHQSEGDRFQLDVVSPEQLLTILEARELGLRRRFEQVISELTETRDMLTRIRAEGPEQAPAPTEPAAKTDGSNSGKASDPTADPTAEANERLKRVWSLRLLRSQQSLLQSQKSAQEVLGIAASFRDIYEELINNRVDTEDRKTRLKEQIATPLQAIGEKQFPELDRALEKLGAAISAVETSGKLAKEDPATAEASRATVDQVNRTLADLDGVLQRMLDLESFNELLDIVRTLIEDQERITTETKKEQKKAVLDLLK